MEKSWALDSIAKGWRAKKISVFPLSQCVLCCPDCNIYFEQPILCPECCCKQQSSWDRLVSEGKKQTNKQLFCFFVLSPGRARFQDWGEEVEEGAVYHVTLKRVQIQQAANKGAEMARGE